MPWTPSKTIPTSPTRPADSRREAGREPPTIVLKMLRKQCCSFMARNGFSWRFDSAGERVSEDPGSLVSRFEQFDAENPLLYDTMVRLARQRAVQNGGHKLSVRSAARCSEVGDGNADRWCRDPVQQRISCFLMPARSCGRSQT